MMRKSSFTFAAVILCLGLMSACGRTGSASSAGSSIVIAGSTSVQPYAEVLAEEYHFLYPDGDIDIQGGGSSAGIMAVENGTASIGMSSRTLSDGEQDLPFVEIAKDGLAFIVHPDNPVENLSQAQVRGIYAGYITDWSELGGPDAKIHLIAREEGSGTRSVFESLVMENERITPRAIVLASNGAIRQFVSGDPHAIGFISLGLVDKTVNAVKLDGVEPIRGNVGNGSYRLYRSFLFVTRGVPDGLARKFIDFTLSEQGQRILEREGLVPVEQLR